MHDPVVALICGLPDLFFFHFRFVFTPIFHSSNCIHNIECKMSRGGLRTRLIWKLITTIPMEMISSKCSQSGESLLCLGDVLPTSGSLFLQHIMDVLHSRVFPDGHRAMSWLPSHSDLSSLFGQLSVGNEEKGQKG